jgi:DNA-binding NtrC family response regulator
MKIVFLDDNTFDLQEYSKVAQEVKLLFGDCYFVYCKDTDEADEEIEKNNIGLLCLDMNLQNQNGMLGGLTWLEKLINEEDKSYPVIAMSGHPEIMDAVRQVTKSQYVDTWDKAEGVAVLRDKIISMLQRSSDHSRLKNLEGMGLRHTEELMCVCKDVRAIMECQAQILVKVTDIAHSDERAFVLVFVRIFGKKVTNFFRRIAGFEEKK